MHTNEKIAKLRELMQAAQISAFIIPSADPHQSEYFADHFKSRMWISGFTGSVGTVVVTGDKAGLWVDGRYFIQAEHQIAGSQIDLHKILPGEPSPFEWLALELPAGSNVAINGKLFSVNQLKEMKKVFKAKNLQIKTDHDFVAEIWDDRPSLPQSPIFIHDLQYAGKSRLEKITELRTAYQARGAQAYIISSLDDIAWLLNIRAGDVPNSPVCLAYCLITDSRCIFFVDPVQVNPQVWAEMEKDQIELAGYENIVKEVALLPRESTVFLDPDRINIWLYQAIPDWVDVIEDLDITTLMKSAKNPTEQEGVRQSQIRDCAALVKAFIWIEQNKDSGTLTEWQVAQKLAECRSQMALFIDTSFNSIIAYRANAAMMHYTPTKEESTTIRPEGFLLLDSGGNYYDGTTDITRTILMGPITAEERHDFTLTLKAYLALERFHFLEGYAGSNLDIIARRVMWAEDLDYKCGTGHGVGYCLNVHEGPQRFRGDNNAPLKEGMLITDEPGVYKEGKHGIRTENILLVVKAQNTEAGQFFKFEPVTFFPIEIDALDLDLLDQGEKDWLNDYHAQTYAKLSPLLNDAEKAWLKHKTRAI